MSAETGGRPLLLDTHVWIWYVEGERAQIASRVESQVESAVQKGSPSVAIESTRLPGSLHRDPADRMIIATARLLGAAIVTRDERILEYARHGHVRVIDATP